MCQPYTARTADVGTLPGRCRVYPGGRCVQGVQGGMYYQGIQGGMYREGGTTLRIVSSQPWENGHHSAHSLSSLLTVVHTLQHPEVYPGYNTGGERGVSGRY